MLAVAMGVEQYDRPFTRVAEDRCVAFPAAHWEFGTAAESLGTRMAVEDEGGH